MIHLWIAVSFLDQGRLPKLPPCIFSFFLSPQFSKGTLDILLSILWTLVCRSSTNTWWTQSTMRMTTTDRQEEVEEEEAIGPFRLLQTEFSAFCRYS